MWYKNIAGRFFGLVIKHACVGQTDRRTDTRTDKQNYDSQDRASIAASRGKNARNALKYHLVTAEPPFTVKAIECVHQTGPRKGA